MRTLAALLVLAVPFASSGTADAPELADASGDCAVPYGNLYLDIVAAWVDGETADTFDVHLQLAGWEDEVAEGAGYAVQFTHQGLTWGIVALYSSVISDGWEFSTGQATAQLAQGFEDAPGSFDAGTATMTVTFRKDIFEHVDASDTTLRDFVAMSADLRPAYPFFLGEDAGLDGNGRWVVCDDAVGSSDYAFTAGGHSAQHAAPASDATPEPEAEAAASSAPETDPTPAPSNDTPLPAALVVVAIALAALRKR